MFSARNSHIRNPYVRNLYIRNSYVQINNAENDKTANNAKKLPAYMGQLFDCLT